MISSEVVLVVDELMKKKPAKIYCRWLQSRREIPTNGHCKVIRIIFLLTHSRAMNNLIKPIKKEVDSLNQKDRDLFSVLSCKSFDLC